MKFTRRNLIASLFPTLLIGPRLSCAEERQAAISVGPHLAAFSLTSTQILSAQFAGEGIQVLAAPGTGKVIIPTFLALKFSPGSSLYTVSQDATIYLGYPNPEQSTVAAPANAGGFLTQSAARIATYPANGLQAPASDLENLGLVLHAPGLVIAGGNGTLSGALSYYVASL